MNPIRRPKASKDYYADIQPPMSPAALAAAQDKYNRWFFKAVGISAALGLTIFLGGLVLSPNRSPEYVFALVMGAVVVLLIVTKSPPKNLLPVRPGERFPITDEQAKNAIEAAQQSDGFRMTVQSWYAAGLELNRRAYRDLIAAYCEEGADASDYLRRRKLQEAFAPEIESTDATAKGQPHEY